MTNRPPDWVYDIETFKDLFSAGFVRTTDGQRYIFEVSDRIDQSAQLLHFLFWMRDIDARLFGFNNEGFDWIVLQHLINIAPGKNGRFTHHDAYLKAKEIFNAGFNNRFGMMVWPDQRTVVQGDLMKIHHFDNFARSTSLKKLEINMRSRMVIDLPYDPDQLTTSDQKDEIIAYMNHDVHETLKFYWASKPQIDFRDELALSNPEMGDVLNMNDTKIGKQYFIKKLEDAGFSCFRYDGGRKQPVQTRRSEVRFDDVISDRVTFQHPEFQRVERWLRSQSLKTGPDGLIVAKGVFNNVSATIDGFSYDFGTGGIHGSLDSTVVREDDEWEIWDWDVASYYPNLAISNRLYPAHLGEAFCDIYEEVYQMRRSHPKGTAGNAMLKLALNGVYGDSNNKHSPFYDPQYTMSITINGQLLLCMLAEWLTQAERGNGLEPNGFVKMIQINTDGLTVKVHKSMVDFMHETCKQWEVHTGLDLECVRYQAMFIRDVNSYIALKTDGKLKRIGAYAYVTPLEDPNTRERPWYKDHSMLVVRKAAEAHMVHGTPIEDFIMGHDNPYDFQITVKLNRTSNGVPTHLWWGDEEVQRTGRYYVSTNGKPLVKEMMKKGQSAPSRTGIDVGWNVTMTNTMDDFDWGTVNWNYYITEARKLVI